MRAGPSFAQISAVDRYVRLVQDADRIRRRSESSAPPDPVVTISRQAGCDAHGVAEALVALLGPKAREGSSPWTVFDRNLVDRVLEEHRLPTRLASYMPEDAVSSVTDSVDEFLGIHPSTAVLVRRTAETIRAVAEVGNAVVIGRAANIVTRDVASAFHVRLVGSAEARARALAEREHVEPGDAAERVRRIDAARRRYVMKYYAADIDDPLQYDLVVNVDRLSRDEIASLIAGVVLRHAGAPTGSSAVRASG